MEYIRLDKTTIDSIANKTAKAFVRELKRQQVLDAQGLVPLKEAADILGVSESHMRAIKDKFPYVKYGEEKNGRYFFKKESLNPVMASLMSDPKKGKVEVDDHK